MKKKIDEVNIYEKHYQQIYKHVKNDPYAQSLGIQLTTFEAGFAEAMLEVRSHMVNAYGTVHGAVLYALADHAFSAACNAYGKTSLGLSTTIQFIESAKPGDKIVARATEVKRNFRTGFYRIDILHGENLIATMEAVSYRKNHYFIEHDEND
ncbi:phenylacetate degradation protein [Bacillus glycinifermentans]|uniref:Hotdog fold thioesterase n=1 Tax=Bacillus glycinifermentans TaxID=1664069 RepID=A0A0J6ECZ9_9BACI|nr:hotdog fold thioesterase [Bacillus glycinifermentans]ATH91871.1 phenylacetate degradation protein [Bacillus glycinifermentans]KMM62917.1 phenylacetate degradation protein [Bacillus glycinifermentans]KRT92901.1 phenylacetate degradation protein [Bacillus glycinifermentans]MEC0486271.1 hotdog fold thioesterase [Bacillus glycinifermentans]MEC0494985.1 hotdog fold thioesterase [Bacillus glycinifermentans]